MALNYHRKNAPSDVRLGSKYLTGDNVVKEIFFSGKSNEIKKKLSQIPQHILTLLKISLLSSVDQNAVHSKTTMKMHSYQQCLLNNLKSLLKCQSSIIFTIGINVLISSSVYLSKEPVLYFLLEYHFPSSSQQQAANCKMLF